MTQYIASPLPSPLYIGTSAAARVWSIKHIRVSILGNLPISDLASNLKLSRDIFHDVARVLYRSMEYVNYEKVQKACTNVTRLRYYTNLVRHINLENNAKDDEHLILQDQSAGSSSDDPLSFTPTKVILWERYDDSMDIACGYYFRDLEEHKIPMEEWEVDRRIRYTHIYGEGNSYPFANEDPTSITDRFYKCWNEGTGLFDSIVDELDLSCVLPSRRLLREMTDISQRHKDGKDISMPRKLRLGISEEDHNSISLIEVFSGLLEELEMHHLTEPYGGQRSLTTTTIHSFFSRSLNWSVGNGNKLKSLNVLLKVEESFANTKGSLDGLNLDHNDKRHLLNLEKFTITLDFHQLPTSQKSLEGVLDRIPDMSQIAKGMIAIGGTGCVYTLDATGTDNDKEVGKVLTETLKVEMMRLWVDSPAEIGWERAKRKEN
ncbi:hypothetical protein V866_005112 [Kwoniella sp. B9012]